MSVEVDPASGKRIVYVKEKSPILKMVIICVVSMLSLCFLVVLAGFIMGLNGMSKVQMDPQIVNDAITWAQGNDPEPLPDELTKVDK